MSHNLPYLSSPGTITRLLPKIMEAAVPPKITTEFIQNTLAIKGGTGAACLPFLKKIGFVTSDGTPSKYYKDFRNPATSKSILARMITKAYEQIFSVNERAFEIQDKDIKGIIVQVTGLDATSRSVDLIHQTFKNLLKFADFSNLADEENIEEGFPHDFDDIEQFEDSSDNGPSNLNLSYTIYLNLPNTTDINVFNAIFKSLKENLISRK